MNAEIIICFVHSNAYESAWHTVHHQEIGCEQMKEWISETGKNEWIKSRDGFNLGFAIC